MAKSKRVLGLRLLSVIIVALVMGFSWVVSVESQSFTVQSSDPAEGSKAVPIEKVLQFVFDAALPQSISELAIETEPETPIIFDIQGERLLIQATENWDYSTDYTVTVPSETSLTGSDPIQLMFRSEPEFTYERDILPLLDAHCVGCHQPQGRQRTQLLDSYDAVLAYVTPGESSSELIDPRWTQRHAPTRFGGGSPEIAYTRSRGYDVSTIGFWNEEQVDIVTTWIVQDKAVESLDALQSQSPS